MKKESLIMFCRVIEEGSISQAARASFISQPAVTSQIRQLEKHYGAALFDRTAGKLKLTEAGSTLYPYAKEIIDNYNRSEEAVKSIVNNDAVTLNIGASLTIGEYLLPRILGDFQKKHKNLKFKLTIGNTPDTISSLVSREIDIALVEGAFSHDEEFKIEKFGEDQLILIVSNEHRWNDRNEIKIEELIEEKMIWREENAGIRKIVEKLLEENNVLNKVESFMELNSPQSIKSAVEAGLGIGIIPKLSVLKELELGVLKQVSISGIELNRNLCLVELPSRFPKKNMDLFIAHLKKMTP